MSYYKILELIVKVLCKCVYHHRKGLTGHLPCAWLSSINTTSFANEEAKARSLSKVTQAVNGRSGVAISNLSPGTRLLSFAVLSTFPSHALMIQLCDSGLEC